MLFLIKLALVALMFGLFIYAKGKPYKDKMGSRHARIHDLLETILGWQIAIFRSIGKPYQIGPGIAMDLGEITLFLLYGFVLIILSFF